MTKKFKKLKKLENLCNYVSIGIMLNVFKIISVNINNGEINEQ